MNLVERHGNLLNNVYLLGQRMGRTNVQVTFCGSSGRVFLSGPGVNVVIENQELDGILYDDLWTVSGHVQGKRKSKSLAMSNLDLTSAIILAESEIMDLIW